MSTFLPSIAYPPPQQHDGYWGPVTSTLDWCEENYYLTHYCAEVVNTFTNAMFAYLGVCGIVNCVRHGHDPVFVVSFVAYLMIGLGSFCFHSSLLYEMQLVDEISMIYTSSVLVYALFSHSQSPLLRSVIGVLVFSLALFVSLYYFHLGDPVFHQIAFTALTLLVVIRGIYGMESTLRPRWRKVVAAVQGRPERWTNGHGAVIRAPKEYNARMAQDSEDLRMLRSMYGLLGYGVFCALLGFAIWTVDTVCCGTLIRWRRKLGMPWGFLLEGHAWWHILTGIAAYCNIVWNIWMRYALHGRRDEIEFVWPSFWTSMPKVVRRDRRKAKGQ